jgi:Cu/Ag efflux protein CusF
MSMTLKRTAMLAALAILVAPMYGRVASAAPVLQADRGAQAPAPAPAIGELSKVDPDAKTLSIKMAGGAEMLFRYTDQTTVTGGEKTVAGLATKSGAQVAVSYRVEGTSNIATRIEVRQKT